jgi:AcrR family transcriptional regulator
MEVFEGEPADTREAIMQATYAALSKHGYADLTIQRIGDEFDKSKSLLYHHYDSKDDLLVDFLAFMLEGMEASVPVEEQADAYAAMLLVLDEVFGDLLGETRDEFRQAMIELRSRAAHDETFRDQFTANQAYIHQRLVDIISDGMEEGVFREVDPDQAAEMLLTTIDGAMLRAATTDGIDPDAVRDELKAYLDLRLLADDVDR